MCNLEKNDLMVAKKMIIEEFRLVECSVRSENTTSDIGINFVVRQRSTKKLRDIFIDCNH